MVVLVMMFLRIDLALAFSSARDAVCAAILLTPCPRRIPPEGMDMAPGKQGRGWRRTFHTTGARAPQRARKGACGDEGLAGAAATFFARAAGPPDGGLKMGPESSVHRAMTAIQRNSIDIPLGQDPSWAATRRGPFRVLEQIANG